MTQRDRPYLQFRQGNDIGAGWSLPYGSLTFSIVVIVALGTGIEQFPPLVFIRSFSEGERSSKDQVLLFDDTCSRFIAPDQLYSLNIIRHPRTDHRAILHVH